MSSPPALSLPGDLLPAQLRALRDANLAFSQRYPGETSARQPVHTVYGGGHLFRADTARKLGDVALRALDAYAPDAKTFADAIALEGTLPANIGIRIKPLNEEW